MTPAFWHSAFFLAGVLVGRVIVRQVPFLRKPIPPAARHYRPTGAEMLATFTYWCRAERLLNPSASDYSCETRAWDRLAGWIGNIIDRSGGATW